MKYLGNVLTDKRLQVSGDKVADIYCAAGNKPKGPVRTAKLSSLGAIMSTLIPALRSLPADYGI